MKRHLITAVLLLFALSLYVLGAAGAGTAAFGAGVVIETWFWARVLMRSHRKLTPTR